jgi:hypothetical protein
MCPQVYELLPGLVKKESLRKIEHTTCRRQAVVRVA